MSCNNCKFAIFRDYGYSNYSVEGTEFRCGRGVHPDGVFDRWYGEDKRLEYGATCSHYTEGNPINMDADLSMLVYLDEFEKAIYNGDMEIKTL